MRFIATCMDEFMRRYNLGTRKFFFEKIIWRISLLVSQSREILLNELPGMFFLVILVFGNYFVPNYFLFGYYFAPLAGNIFLQR